MKTKPSFEAMKQLTLSKLRLSNAISIGWLGEDPRFTMGCLRELEGIRVQLEEVIKAVAKRA